MGVPLMGAFSEATERDSTHPGVKNKMAERISPRGKYFFTLSSQLDMRISGAKNEKKIRV
jgi:hypothetical protein